VSELLSHFASVDTGAGHALHEAGSTQHDENSPTNAIYSPEDYVFSWVKQRSEHRHRCGPHHSDIEALAVLEIIWTKFDLVFERISV
jgi:hypothetical protein